MVKSITDKLNYLFKHGKYFGSMCLLKLHKHRHGNSIYFMCDNMVCFPKSSHKLCITFKETISRQLNTQYTIAIHMYIVLYEVSVFTPLYVVYVHICTLVYSFNVLSAVSSPVSNGSSGGNMITIFIVIGVVVAVVVVAIIVVILVIIVRKVRNNKHNDAGKLIANNGYLITFKCLYFT